MNKDIKISLFSPNASKENVLYSNGEHILDNILISSNTEESLSDFNYFAELKFYIDKDGLYKNISEESILKIRTYYGTEIFRVCRVTKTSEYIYVVALQITIADSLNIWLTDVRPEGLNGVSALEWIIKNSNEYKDGIEYAKNIELFSDIDKTSTAYYMDINLYNALHDSDQSFNNRWGGEVLRRGYRININNKIGEDRGFQVRSKKNLKGFESDTNINSICTRIKPKGFDGITISGFVDSPLINNYSKIYTNQIKYDDVKVKNENNDEGYDTLEEAQEELIRRAKLEFSEKNIDKLQANYRVNFVNLSKTEEYKNYSVLERVELGDIVYVHEENLDIDISVRVVRIKYNSLNNRIEEIELSNMDLSKLNPPTLIELMKEIDNIPTSESILSEAKKSATSLINAGLKDSYVVLRQDEILIMDTKDINTATKVWRWTNGGLGYSSTGYYGEFGTAITQDGKIVADFITTGILNAGLIKTGVLKSFNNRTWINMEDGSFNFHDKIKWNGNNLEIRLDDGSILEDFTKSTAEKESQKGSNIKIGFNKVTNGEVVIDNEGLRVNNGKFQLVNENNTVVIDGKHNIHKIVSEGIVSLNYTGMGEVSATIPHNLGYKPAFSAYQLGANGLDEYTNLPAITWSNNQVKAIIRARCNNNSLIFEYKIANDYDLSPLTIYIKYFIYKEVAF